MFELFSEAVRSHYGVQCTCSAEKLVLAVRLPCLMVFIIIYVVTTVVTAKFIRIIIASFTKMTVHYNAAEQILASIPGRVFAL